MSFLHSLLAPVLGGVFRFQSKRKLPKIEGHLELYGLQEEVTIYRDKWGVPHLQASNDHDLYLAQGLIHCQDRLFQMEVNRRVARGTLSEIFGELTVDTDRLSRTLGFYRLGQADKELQSKKAMAAIEAYVQGINSYINHLDTKLPLEFGLIKFRPENWTVDDVLSISRMVTWQLSHAWYGEVVRTQLIEAVGEEHAELLEIHYREDNPIQLPEGIEFNAFVKGQLKKVSGPFLDTAMGSNGWVVSKDRSKTGSPLLANDMHLTLRLPSIWYHNHLRSKELNVTGVSLPGMPLVLVGHNSEIAWGATLSYNDCEDLFVEKFDEQEPTKYEFKGKQEEAEILYEIIKVKDGLNQQQKVIITRHGPIISDFIPSQEHVALHSKSLQPLTSITGWFDLNYAGNWNEFVEAIKQINAPSLNLVYADKENIGYYNTGRVPIRTKGDGRFPVPGWDGAHEWKGEIPFEEMPHALNPEKGYFITCNNKVISDDYKHAKHLGENFMNGFRARRLETYFNEHEKIGFEESRAMQMDIISEAAPIFIEHLQELEVTDPNPAVPLAFKELQKFDGNLAPNSVGAALYELTKHMTSRLLLEPHLGKELTNTYLGDGLHEVLLPSHEFFAQDLVTVLRLLESDNWWVKHAGGKEKLLISAFKRGFEYLMDHLGSDWTKWTWGRLHTLTFDHALAVQPPLDRIFSRGPYPIGGDDTTPLQSSATPSSFVSSLFAPSWRQIVDLGDMSRSEWMYSPGQSGQLASKHYDNLIKPWLEGTYASMLWTRGQIESQLEGALTLLPPRF